MQTIDVLDKGHVQYMDHMGTDLTVVNAARVSFDKESDWASEYSTACCSTEGGSCPYETEHLNTLSERDRSLIFFLARGLRQKEWDAEIQKFCDTTDPAVMEKMMLEFRRRAQHWAPFSHAMLSVRIKAPLFVARQLFKHKVGFAESEISMRYVKHSTERYVPKEWRGVPEAGVKQGSEGVVEVKATLAGDIEVHRQYSSGIYTELLSENVAPELARIELPMATYTEWILTGSVAAFARLYNQRIDSHAQWEAQQYAKAIGEIVESYFPVSWEALTQ